MATIGVARALVYVSSTGKPGRVVGCRAGRRTACRVGALMVAAWVVVVLLAGCQAGEPMPQEVETELSVSSQAFGEGEGIPAEYTCQGRDVSPPLAWTEPPAGTASFVVIADDLDSPRGVFTHWVLFNIPSDARELAEAVPAEALLPNGALQCRNGFGSYGYRGPCPPSGTAHRYRFSVYALDQTLGLEAGASRTQVEDAMRGHILAQGQLTGIYHR